MSDTLASAIDALWHPLPGAGFTLGYGTNGFADHPLDRAIEVLEVTGYGAIALTLGHPHLDPFAADADEQAARLRERLDELGWRVVVETGTRYLLDPFVKHRPTLVDVDAESRMRVPAPRDRPRGRCCVPSASRCGRASCPMGCREPRPGRCSSVACARSSPMPRHRGSCSASSPSRACSSRPSPTPCACVTSSVRPPRSASPSTWVTASRSNPTASSARCAAAGDLLVNVQVDDMLPGVHEHLELGSGRLDLTAALTTLNEIGYRGVAAVELPRHSHDAPGAAARSMRALRSAWEER